MLEAHGLKDASQTSMTFGSPAVFLEVYTVIESCVGYLVDMNLNFFQGDRLHVI